MNHMVKTILVPIDFRVASLNTLKLALESRKDYRIKVILMYSEFLSNSIADLLFYSPDKIINSHLTSEFNEALEILKNRYVGMLSDVQIKLFHGNGSSSLNAFLIGHKIDEIFVPKTYRLMTPKKGFSPIPFIRKNSISVFEIEWSTNNNNSQTEQEQLTALFI